jgi:hypothetical protein
MDHQAQAVRALPARVICLENAFAAAWTEKPVSAPDHISKSEAENIVKDVLKNGETLRTDTADGKTV